MMMVTVSTISKKFTEPIVQALQSLGVRNELTGRNDIQIGQAKISANAMVKVKNRMFSHGTLNVK